MKRPAWPILTTALLIPAAVGWGAWLWLVPESRMDTSGQNVFAQPQPPSSSEPAMETNTTNRLASSFSPYLRQHMHNPVDWYSWGDEALEKARRENKPILVSVGYSTCYWCHVLEREVFSRTDVAALMRENVVAIKVDREVRPDIDEIFMTATQAMIGHGGWPNNVFLTPDLEPFYATTYLPKNQWMSLIAGVGEAWRTKRDEIDDQAGKVAVALAGYLAGASPAGETIPFDTLPRQLLQGQAQFYDGRDGGFGTGTKFPQETGLLFLLDYAVTQENTDPEGARQAVDMARNTVDHMIQGGILDHVGGGFHRYATDRQWLLPHFEKMLYNQGLMAVVLARLREMTGEAVYGQVLERLLAYVERRMTAGGGAFHSALDAETDAVEGAYYVWSPAALEQVLGRENRDFLLEHYGLTPLRHFEGHQYPDGDVLHRKTETPDAAAQQRLDGLLEQLLAARAERRLPLRDDKILVAWNGMMILGYAQAARVLDEPAYLRAAEQAAQFILDNMVRDDGGLYRIYLDGQAHQNAFLEDYAWLAKGFLALYRAGGDARWKDQAIRLLRLADRDFLDESTGGYFLTDGTEGLPVRLRKADDAGALPAANAVMVHALADLYAATGEDQWKAKAESIAGAFGQGVLQQPSRYNHLVYGMMRMAHPARDWLEPVEAARTRNAGEEKAARGAVAPASGLVLGFAPPAGGAPLNETSKDKVDVRAQILREVSTDTRKSVRVSIEIDEGWHLNANPASLDELVPTVVDVQTAGPSSLNVSYPAGKKMLTPLGDVSVFDGTVEINASVEAGDPIDEGAMRVLVQVQACKDALCYPPSQIAVTIPAPGESRDGEI